MAGYVYNEKKVENFKEDLLEKLCKRDVSVEEINAFLDTTCDMAKLSDERLKDMPKEDTVVSGKYNQSLGHQSISDKIKLAKMKFLLYWSLKSKNFSKFEGYIRYKAYKSYETRDDWGKVNATRGVSRDGSDARKTAFMAAKLINNAIKKGILTDNISGVINAITIQEPNLALWGIVVAKKTKEKIDPVDNRANLLGANLSSFNKSLEKGEVHSNGGVIRNKSIETKHER